MIEERLKFDLRWKPSFAAWGTRGISSMMNSRLALRAVAGGLREEGRGVYESLIGMVARRAARPRSLPVGAAAAIAARNDDDERIGAALFLQAAEPGVANGASTRLATG